MKKCPACGFQLISHDPLTKKQAEVYAFLVSFIREHKHAPSFEEIATTFNYGSLASVHEHLGNLERKGYIHRQFNERRSITCLVDLDEIGDPPIDLTATEDDEP